MLLLQLQGLRFSQIIKKNTVEEEEELIHLSLYVYRQSKMCHLHLTHCQDFKGTLTGLSLVIAMLIIVSVSCGPYDTCTYEHMMNTNKHQRPFSYHLSTEPHGCKSHAVNFGHVRECIYKLLCPSPAYLKCFGGYKKWLQQHSYSNQHLNNIQNPALEITSIHCQRHLLLETVDCI